MTASPETDIKAVDSLSANEFQVELNGTPVAGVFSVSGLTSFAMGENFPPLTITKMVQQDATIPFNVWTRATLAGGKPVLDLAIVAVDEGEETRRWVYRDAYIVRISFSDFDTALSELVAEQITIKADRVEEIWPS